MKNGGLKTKNGLDTDAWCGLRTTGRGSPLVHAACVLILILGWGRLSAQPLDSLIAEAMRNNPGLRSTALRATAAGFRANAAGALPPPTLGIEFSQIPFGSADALNASVSNNLSMAQMFMPGGKLSAMAEAERQGAGVLFSLHRSAEAQLRARVTMAYVSVWLADRRIDIQQRSIETLDKACRTIQSQVQLSRSRQGDLLLVEAGIAVQRAVLMDIQSKRRSEVYALNALLGREDSWTPITIDSLPSRAALLIPSQPVERLRRDSPAFASMTRMLEMNSFELSAAKKDLIPDIMVQGMIMRMPSGMVLTAGSPATAEMPQASVAGPMPSAKTEWMYSVMASITLPFMPWSSNKVSARIDELEAKGRSLQAERESMERTMVAQLLQYLEKIRGIEERTKLYEERILPLSRNAVDDQVSALQTGQSSLSLVLEAIRMKLMREDEYVMLIADKRMALAEVEMMVGQPL